MKTIETTIEVDDQGRATIQLPGDVKPGPYRAVLWAINEPSASSTHPLMADFPRHDVTVNLPEDFTFRREQIYDDDGRGG